jgi:hypothetical protein
MSTGALSINTPGATGRKCVAAAVATPIVQRDTARGFRRGLKVAPFQDVHTQEPKRMNVTMKPGGPAVEYRFNATTGEHDCPLCGSSFQTVPGSWPFITGTVTPVCGGPECPIGDDAADASPCNTLFAFGELDPATLAALAATPGEALVAERLRDAGLNESLPLEDRNLLNRAAIDLLFWEAESTRIAAIRPRLVLQTCPEAAAEMLLSGCGDIV